MGLGLEQPENDADGSPDLWLHRFRLETTLCGEPSGKERTQLSALLTNPNKTISSVDRIRIEKRLALDKPAENLAKPKIYRLTRADRHGYVEEVGGRRPPR